MTAASPPPEFLEVFARLPGAGKGVSFATFMEVALYDPVVGYYRRPRKRVGYSPGTDFYTATTSGPVYGELVAAACAKLLGEASPRDYTFVEIGAEPEGGVLAGVQAPFAAVKTCRVGDPIEITGKCIVFSNELFDAQPFRRFRFHGGKWQELGVALHGDQLLEVVLRSPAAPLPPELPLKVAKEYTIDAPLAARTLAEKIAAQPWTGLFVAVDYGKSWQELAEATPAGTARAYVRHTQSNDLLAQPGEQDLTCHICWDWISDALLRHGFKTPALETQESFFIRHAESYIAPAIVADAARLTPRKQTLMQLLHGAHLGFKFQALHAQR